MNHTEFFECTIRETDFSNANLTESNFSGSDLQGSKFQNTILGKADLSKARNYYIDPTQNKIRHAKFSYPEVLALLDPFGIVLR